MAEDANQRDAFQEQVDEIFSWRLEHFPRVIRLREEILRAEPAVALMRSKLLMDYFENNGFDPQHPQLRQAQSLKYILQNLQPVIFPDELIVGSCTEHRLGCVMFPEFQAAIIWPEILKLPFRKRHPVSITKEAIEEFSFRIFPYFKDKNIHDWTKARLGDKECLRLQERLVFYLVAQPNGVSHLIPDYFSAVKLGFNRIKEMAKEKRARLSGNDKLAQGQKEFYQAVEIVSEGVLGFAKNHSRKCQELAESETSPERKKELLELARILSKVPAEPAESFYEALQSLWLTHIAVLQENSDLAVSFGRLDQFLMPYYEKDVSKGVLDAKRAMELLMCFYIKTNDHTPLVPEMGEALFSGSATNQSITLSGVDANGNDCTNLLSYMMVKALDLLRLREPNVDARFHQGSPELWYEKVLDTVRSTGAAPALYNDDAIVPALIAKGARLEDARDYGVIGCVETTVQAKAYGMTGAILLNLGAILELTLNNGIHPFSGMQIGPQTGYLKDFQSFDQVWTAFLGQLNFMVSKSVEAEIAYDESHKQLHPIPLLSAVMVGPMEKGKDLTEGGAVYNSSGVWVVGLADVADSMVALKRLVFEERRISAEDMQSALKADFKGYKKIQAMCLNRAPKYGNDDPEADDMAKRIVEEVDRAYGRYTNYRGGPYHIGYWTMTMHTGYGKLTSAFPSGRNAGKPMASGATPVSGVARKGPSSALSSTAKLPPHCLANSIANNHKIPLSLLQEPGKMKVLEQLVKGYFKKGGLQVQFVIADKSSLVQAMNDPELAKDLLVRVSGYTAYFGDLTREMQEEIINRTEDQI